MRMTPLVAAALGAALVVMGCNKTTNPHAGSGSVNIVSNASTKGALAYSPDSLHVIANTEVTWTNNDNVTHTVTSSAGSSESFDSGNITPGGTFKRTFEHVGIYPYHCSIHPTMVGAIVVQ